MAASHPDRGLEDYPESLLAFLAANGLDTAPFARRFQLPRYVRLSLRGATARLTPQLLQLQLGPGVHVTRVEGAGGGAGAQMFWRVTPGDTKIVGCNAYQKAQIYGVDLSSGIAVLALGAEKDDNILDMCCAPGAKLCMIAEILGDAGTGTVTGVDISEHRAASCRSLLKKYAIRRARLFVADGTVFDFAPPREFAAALSEIQRRNGGSTPGSSSSGNPPVSTSAASEKASEAPESRAAEFDAAGALRALEGAQSGCDGSANVEVPGGYTGFDDVADDAFQLALSAANAAVTAASSRERMPFWAPKLLRQPAATVADFPDCLYDKVLVDAECTHDGSLVHITKYEGFWGWDKFEKNVLNPERIRAITDLQYKLLSNGLHLLKPGGTLVYSTCSLTLAQNEEVVARFLAERSGEVELVPMPEVLDRDKLRVSPARPNSRGVDLGHAFRFDPAVADCSGLFVARMRKTCVADVQ